MEGGFWRFCGGHGIEFCTSNPRSELHTGRRCQQQLKMSSQPCRFPGSASINCGCSGMGGARCVASRRSVGCIVWIIGSSKGNGSEEAWLQAPTPERGQLSIRSKGQGCGSKETEQERQVIHYTLNTGHAVASPRPGVGPEAIAALQPLTEHGGLIPGCAPFRVTVDSGPGAAVFTIWRGKTDLLRCSAE